MLFPLHITVGEFRKLTADSPDAAPLFIRYGEVVDDYHFVRIDGLHAEVPGDIRLSDKDDKETVESYPYPCPVLTISITDGNDDEDDDNA